MTEDVAALVLQDNYEQAETLSLAEANATSMFDVHERFLRFLETRRNLNRELEALPSDEEIGERKREHGGLTRPELAVLLAYSKIDLYDALLDSDVPEDPYLSAELERYFPPPLPERFGEQMRAHRLGRQIVATQVVNNVLHGGGTTFAFRLHEETGAPASQIARAYACAREIFEMRPLWTEIEALDTRCDSSVQITLLLEGRRLVERASRWLLGNRPRELDIASTVRHFRPGAMALYASITRLLAPEDAEPLARGADELRERGVPEDLATRVAALPIMFSALDIVTVADEIGLDVERVAAVHFRLGSRLGLHWLRDQIVALPRDDRWRARARAALRDDLYAIHRELTREVLRSAPAGIDPDELVDSWIEGNPASARMLQTLGDIRRRAELRPHDAARGGARGTQPDRRLDAAGELLAHLPEPAGRVLVARPPAWRDHRGVAALLAHAVGTDVGAALQVRVGGGVELRQRAHRRALGDHVVGDLHEEAVDRAAARRSAGSSPRSRGARRAPSRSSPPRQAPVELEREQQVRELGLPVGAPAEVVAVARPGCRRRCGPSGARCSRA